MRSVTLLTALSGKGGNGMTKEETTVEIMLKLFVLMGLVETMNVNGEQCSRLTRLGTMFKKLEKDGYFEFVKNSKHSLEIKTTKKSNLILENRFGGSKDLNFKEAVTFLYKEGGG
jgi:hypothetical protein